MDRKKFVALFSTSLIGAVLLKLNPLNLIGFSKNRISTKSVEIKINPLAVNREKSGNKNG